MPKPILLYSIISFPLLAALGVFGQGITIWNEQVFSTGQTTGHIATLVITNHTGLDYEYSLPACIIPASGTAAEKNLTQPMYSKPIGTTPIPSGGQTEILVYGYCLDIFKPPLEEGGKMPSPEQWIKPGITISDLPQPPNGRKSPLVFAGWKKAKADRTIRRHVASHPRL